MKPATVQQPILTRNAPVVDVLPRAVAGVYAGEPGACVTGRRRVLHALCRLGAAVLPHCDDTTVAVVLPCAEPLGGTAGQGDRDAGQRIGVARLQGRLMMI